jgi:hypothetical protein
MQEKMIIIAQSSLTYAYKGESILKGNGIWANTIRLSGQKTQNGCGYGLSLKESDLNRALMLLRAGGAFVGQIIR